MHNLETETGLTNEIKRMATRSTAAKETEDQMEVIWRQIMLHAQHCKTAVSPVIIMMKVERLPFTTYTQKTCSFV